MEAPKKNPQNSTKRKTKLFGKISKEQFWLFHQLESIDRLLSKNEPRKEEMYTTCDLKKKQFFSIFMPIFTQPSFQNL